MKKTLAALTGQIDSLNPEHQASWDAAAEWDEIDNAILNWNDFPAPKVEGPEGLKVD